MEHFKTDNDYKPSIAFGILMSVLVIFTLGATWIFAYEMWAEPKYWKNRWKLYHLLKQGKVKVEYIKEIYFGGDRIHTYQLDIDGIEYSVWIYSETAMTLDYDTYGNNELIGLFIGSLTTRRLSKTAIREIERLSNL